MASADVYSIDGRPAGSVELPAIFSTEVRPWLISRAVVVEQSRRMQPQGHFVLAGMQTTAAYYGAMMSYRSGRHVGKAIRPREKLGGGSQGRVRRIPSATSGKRAHPHMVEKRIWESMNAKEYRGALASAIASTASRDYAPASMAKDRRLPIVVSDELESVKKTKDAIKVFSGLGISTEGATKERARKGPRRAARQRRSSHLILIVVNDDKGIVKAARNIPGVEVSTLASLKVEQLAPGGSPHIATIWSESAVKNVAEAVKSKKIE